MPSALHGVSVTFLGQFQDCGRVTSMEGQGQSGGEEGMGASVSSWVVCTRGRFPFYLLLWCVWQCLWETLRAGKGWLWLPLVLKLGWGKQSHWPPRSLSGLLSPGP